MKTTWTFVQNHVLRLHHWLVSFLRKNWKHLVLVAAALLIPTFVPMRTSTLLMLNMAGIYAVAAMGYNILLGVSGQASLGHAALIGIGAYTSANLAGLEIAGIGQIPYPLVLLLSGLAAVIVGVVLGFPAIRLGGYYLAIATLGFGEVIQQVFMEWPLFTRGNRGMSVPTPELYGILNLRDRVHFWYLVVIVLVLMYILGQSILNGKVGRALKAMRDSAHAAQAMGINTAYYKLIAFGISAFYAGVAGSLWAHLIRFIMPENFNILVSLSLMAMVAIGGLGLLSGAFWGSAFYNFIPVWVSRIPFSFFATIPSSILTGLALVLVIMFMPYGLVGLPHRILGAWLQFRSKHWGKGLGA